MKFYRILLITQSGYTLLTALWPLIDIKSFMFVSGYKTDVWLVKTVAALLIPISLTLASFLFVRSNSRQAVLLGATTALSFITIDFYYALTDVINDIYMADGVLEIIFLIGWIMTWRKLKARD
jgi:hypothetical protein